MTLWTEEEIDYLERYCYEPEETIEEVAMFLGRSRSSVASKIKRMRENHDIPLKLRPYTQKEVNYIKRKYAALPAKEIAEHLNRPVGSVMEKARLLGISKQKSLVDYDVEIRSLTAFGKTTVEIGKQLGISDRQVADYCYRNNINFRRISNQERNNRSWRKAIFMS